jgi:serine/threonine protein kinase
MVPQPALLEPLRRWDPEQINGYALIGRLGAGSMGRVYLGKSPAGRLVAVKTIKIELADEPHFRTRFAQEVAAARRVSGAFTAAVVAADPEADLPWLATTYVAAPSLSMLVRACGPLPTAAVRWLGAGCAEALESIHGAGLVHRDLKPSNVLVSTDGPRVIDFGIARVTERMQLTLTRGAVGTPAYMAPEQARDTRQASLASDIFSLGATMLFAATGHAPYQGDTIMDVLVKLATEPPDLSGLPSELTDIVSACLQRDPRRRPTSASVLAHLAPGTGSDGRELGPGALPDSALTLIAQYRRDPQPNAEPALSEDSAEERTFGSHPVLSIPGHASGGRQAPEYWMDRVDEPGGPGHRRHGPQRERHSTLVLTAAITAILLVAGALIGAWIADSPHSTAAGPTTPHSGSTNKSLPAHSPGHSLAPDPGYPPGALRQSGLGVLSVLVPQGPPPLPRPAPNGDGPRLSRQVIALSRTTGSGHRTFKVYGYGWPPGVRLLLTLTRAGSGSRSEPLPVDTRGNFNYWINVDYQIYRRGLAAGSYRVVVSGPLGIAATANFTVQAS